jgi:hypothetical protein
MGENTLESPKIVVTKYNFYTFQNYTNMWTPNVMAIMWTLGRFEKFNT